MIAALAAAALAAATAAPVVAAAPRTAVIDLGGARAYSHADQASPLAAVELFVRAGLDRQTSRQSGIAALVAETVLRTPVDPGPGFGQAVPLVDAVDAHGASIGYVVSAQHVRFYLEGTPDGLAAAAPLVARALAGPAFDTATIAAARAVLAARSADEEGDPRFVGLQLLRSSYYRGPAGLPALGDAGSVAALGPADAKAFFARWYLRGDAFVAAVGRTGDVTDAAGRALVHALAPGTAPAAALATRPFGAQPKRIVTHRDVAATYVVLGFAAPALGDRDFPAALVLRALLAGVFERPGATTLPPVFRAAGTLYGYDAAPAQLVLWINGSQLDPELGLTGIDTLLKRAAAKPLTAAVLSRYKETARGAWTLETVSLDQRAFAVGNAVAHGLDADVTDAVGGAIARVTAADVQRVAKKYFQRFDVALVMPRATEN
ncbi:MAG: zinc protease [Candidatus Eremiobacteraeota bacterium]|nr:zinc protease [Candidatus Eremiobacteraeota bacterium]